MKKILLATLTVLALSPTLIFARHGDGTEVEIHKSSDHAMVTSVATGSGSTKGTGIGAGKVNIQDIHRSSGSGATGSGWTSSGRINTGALIEANLKSLHLDMAKLTPEQKVVLTKMIREYLVAQGVTLSTPELKVSDVERKGWDGSIKGNKTANELKIERKQKLEEIKVKREALKTARNEFNSSRSNREKGN